MTSLISRPVRLFHFNSLHFLQLAPFIIFLLFSFVCELFLTSAQRQLKTKNEYNRTYGLEHQTISEDDPSVQMRLINTDGLSERPVPPIPGQLPTTSNQTPTCSTGYADAYEHTQRRMPRQQQRHQQATRTQRIQLPVHPTSDASANDEYDDTVLEEADNVTETVYLEIKEVNDGYEVPLPIPSKYMNKEKCSEV